MYVGWSEFYGKRQFTLMLGAILASFIAYYSLYDHGKSTENLRHIWFTLNYILILYLLALKEATGD
jgi:hypothetical protein